MFFFRILSDKVSAFLRNNFNRVVETAFYVSMGTFFRGQKFFWKLCFFLKMFCTSSNKNCYFFKKKCNWFVKTAYYVPIWKLSWKVFSFRKFGANFGHWAKNLCPFLKIVSAVLSKLHCIAGVHFSSKTVLLFITFRLWAKTFKPVVKIFSPGLSKMHFTSP